MPTLESKTITQGVLTLAISLQQDELVPHVERAARELQQKHPLAGFRPGKAPLTESRRAYGEMALLEEALKYAVPSAFIEIVKQNSFLTIGQPEIQITKLTPNEPLEFTAIIPLLPSVKLGDYRQIKEQKQTVNVSDKEVEDMIEEIRQMRASQKLVSDPATADDRVVIDIKMSKGGVPIEGGQAASHAIDLFKPYFIEGFPQQIIGLKADDSKKFSLPFPKEHYNPVLRGALIDFEVTVKGVYKYERPAIDDAFAASVGKFANFNEFKKQIQKNLEEMKRQEENARLERALTENLIKQSTFGDIPPILLESELNQMAARLKTSVEKEGGSWADYLEHLKKNEKELIDEMRPEALKRVKAALLMRAIGEAENITVSPEEITTEQEAALKQYQDDAETQNYIQSEDYSSHLKHMIMTRKVMQRLIEIAVR